MPGGVRGLRIRWESQRQRGAAGASDGIREGIKAGSLKPLGHGKSGHIAPSLDFYFQGTLGAGKVDEVPWGKAGTGRRVSVLLATLSTILPAPRRSVV